MIIFTFQRYFEQHENNAGTFSDLVDNTSALHNTFSSHDHQIHFLHDVSEMTVSQMLFGNNELSLVKSYTNYTKSLKSISYLPDRSIQHDCDRNIEFAQFFCHKFTSREWGKTTM